jgi:predicted ribosomally synthesized peptide with nif11-like leader
MSTENITAFFAKVQADPAVAEKIVRATAEATAAVAQKEGLTFTAEELLHFQAHSLSDGELEDVAGGRGLPKYVDPNFTEEQRQERINGMLDAGANILQHLSGIGLINKYLK